MDYRLKLSDLGIDVHKIRGRAGKVLCPKCSHTRKKKKDPCLSVNLDEGWYKCYNCEWKGNVKFEGLEKPKEYARPNLINQTQCSNEIVQYFLSRMISQSTLIKNHVMSGMTWMPQTGKEEYCIQFNYIRNNQPINIKHRDGNKNFRMEKDAELIFYGLDKLKDSDEYIILVEGEIDLLSFNECGIEYVLSVPNGAAKSSSSSLEYLDNCWDYFKNNKKVIIATDNDNAGMILREELSRRIGKHRCYKIDFKDVKDANEYLVKYGSTKLAELIQPQNLIEYPMRGVMEVHDVWDNVKVTMDQGMDRGVTTGVFRNVDDHISFDGSKLAVVTGIPNSGKSPFVDMVMISLSIRHGWKWGICSMENKPLEMYIVKLCEKIIGKFIRPKQPLTEEQMTRLKNFIADHFFFIEANYDNDETDTLEFILNAAEDLVRRKGIKGLTIDPWNKIEHKMKPGDNETNYVSKALDQIIRFEQKHDLFTFLVAHPAKPKKTKFGEYEVPDLYSVSGSSNFYNKPDWGITVHRNYKSGLTEVHFNKVKWDHLGKRGAVALKYNGGNGRLGDPEKGLDFSNWLDSLVFITDPVSSEQEIDYEMLALPDGSIPDDAPF